MSSSNDQGPMTTITNIRACQPIATNSPPDWRTSMGQILVAVDTDQGLTGFGVGGGGAAGVHVVRTVLRDQLVGRPLDPIEVRWQEMYDATLAFGRKGLAIMALSGVDLALWDLRGKGAGQTVAALLGGSVAKPIPTYVTVWDTIPATLVGRHRAFKIHVGNSTETTIEQIERTVADARQVVGPGVQLMLDAWMKWTVPFTLAVARGIEQYDVAWIEEPLSPDDLDGYAELARACPIPIAGGEHEFTAAGFGDIIRRRLHQVLQPDACWCGGMTELVKIYRLARAHGLRVCPHRGAEPWGLHAIAALDPEPLAESGRPWMTWVEGQPEIHDGIVQVPDRPGFGVSFDPETLALLH
jgi:L-alanine-DL-glutamate epimerase-like enolase superfamily enzyme